MIRQLLRTDIENYMIKCHPEFISGSIIDAEINSA